MKKTYNINISGMSFVIDEDAYDILDSYLATLQQVCSRAGQAETADDIERRFAEIFAESHAGGRQIITKTFVEEIIGRIGSPEEIVEIEVEPAGAPVPPPPPGVCTVRTEKRLFRDTEHKVLGGVCSGLAWYIGIDVVWIRLVMVALAFLSGSVMAVIYIILWIAVPPAKTPLERMQMMGVDPSVRNVGRMVTGAYDADMPRHQASCRRGSDSWGEIGRVVLMCFTVLGLLVAGSLLLAMSVAFVGCAIAVCVLPGGHYTDASSITEARLIMGCVMGGCLVVGVPLFLLFRTLLGVLTRTRYRAFTVQQRLFLAIPWILGVAACIVCGILLG